MIVTDPKDIAHAEAAAERVVETHRRLVAFLRPGLTLAEIDSFVGATLQELGLHKGTPGTGVAACAAALAA